MYFIDGLGEPQILGVAPKFWEKMNNIFAFSQCENWADFQCLTLGDWGKVHPSANHYFKPRYLDPEEFNATVAEGDQVTVTWHQGKLQDPRTKQWRPWEDQI